MTSLRTQYDFTLAIDGKTYGYFLWEDENSVRHWNEGLAPLLAPQQRVSEFSYEHIPPEIDVISAFESWEGGSGHTEHTLGTESSTHHDQNTSYNYSQGIDASYSNRLYLSPKQIADNASTGGAVASAPSFYFSSLTFGFWLAAGVYVYKYDLSTGTWVLKITGSAAATSMAELNGVLYVSFTGVAYQYTTDTANGTTWVAFSAATLNSANIADMFIVRNATLLAMRSEKAYITTNGQNGGVAWSAGTTIGSSSETTQSVAVANGEYWIFKKEGIYNWDGTTVTDVWHPKFFNSDNGKYSYVGHDGIIYVTYNSRILGINPFATDTSPMAFVYPPEEHQPHDSVEIKGTISQITGTFTDLIFVVTNPAGRAYLMKGSPNTGVFHTLAYLGSVTCNACFATGTGLQHSTNSTIAVGSGVSAAHYILPRADLRPQDDSNCQFALTGTIYGPWVSYGARAFNKFLNRGTVLATMNSAGANITLSYQLDDDTTTTTELVNAVNYGLNSTSTSSTVSFNRLRYVITLNTVDPGSSPIMIGATFHATLNPPRRRIWKPIIILKQNQFGRDAITDRQDVAVLRSALYSGAVNRITMTDRDNNSYIVRILDLQELQIQFASQGGNETDNQVMQLSLAEISPVTNNLPVARYGQARYGAGYVYGSA